MSRLVDELDLHRDEALAQVGDTAKTLAAALGQGSAIEAAVKIAAVTMQKRPDVEAPALWRARPRTNGRLRRAEGGEGVAAR